MTLKSKEAGAQFVISESKKDMVVTPEDFSEEQLMFAETTREFIEKEVVPNDEKIEALDYELTVDLLRKAGEMGLLGADVPSTFGGLELDKVSSTLITESLAKGSSFSLSASVHTGIGTLPIVFFGNREQKKKYLPDLATGTKLAAYCLTEPTSGSDALGAKATATLSEDGTYYVLNGEKQFITNAGFADIFIVYAKVDGTDFTAFIVESSMEGVSLGPEEKKMGIKGSSTRPVILDDVKVPVENLLGERGRGHVIAFNILNIGRFKLATGALGSAKEAIELSSTYANERKQFGTPISSFPLIQEKLAEMNTRVFALESIIYRTAGLIDSSLQGLDHDSQEAGRQSAKGIAEYAMECSINKVFGSETLDFVVDEGVQIHGGYGYINEYKIERLYRDSRINRLFEGTNEINRLLIPGTVLKKARKEELALFEKMETIEADIQNLLEQDREGLLEQEKYLVDTAKAILLFVFRQAVKKYDHKLQEEQVVLSYLSDMITEIFSMESVCIRTTKMVEKQGEEKAKNAIDMTQVYLDKGLEHIESLAKDVLVSLEEGDQLQQHLTVLEKLCSRIPMNTIDLKINIGARVAKAEHYVV